MPRPKGRAALRVVAPPKPAPIIPDVRALDEADEPFASPVTPTAQTTGQNADVATMSDVRGVVKDALGSFGPAITQQIMEGVKDIIKASIGPASLSGDHAKIGFVGSRRPAGEKASVVVQGGKALMLDDPDFHYCVVERGTQSLPGFTSQYDDMHYRGYEIVPETEGGVNGDSRRVIMRIPMQVFLKAQQQIVDEAKGNARALDDALVNPDFRGPKAAKAGDMGAVVSGQSEKLLRENQRLQDQIAALSGKD